MLKTVKKLENVSEPTTLRVTLVVKPKVPTSFGPYQNGSLLKYTKLLVRVNFEKDPELLESHGPDLLRKVPTWATLMDGTPFAHHKDGRMYLRFFILETVQQYFKYNDEIVDKEEVQKYLPEKNVVYSGPVFTLVNVENIHTCVIVNE